MKRVAHWVLLAMLALGTVARAQEEDDDPKAKPAATVKPKSEPKPESKPESKIDSRPETKAEKKVEPKAKPEAKTAEASPKAKPADASPKAKAEPAKKTPAPVTEDKTEVTVEKIADAPAKDAAAKKDRVKTLPKLARAPEPLADPPPREEPAAAARSVRVRLVDGSTVVGTVRVEQPDALVVDCSLGQLSIPRTRISTIAYDAAAGVGAKRAPVQQLDDDAPTPRKRPASP
jgi:hypothetical protein